MFPIICKIGPLTVYSYGLMLAIGVILCAFLLSKEIKNTDITMDFILDLIFWVVLFGILGARIFYILLNLEFYMNHPAEIIMIHKGGLAWQGSLILGSLTGGIFIKRKGLELLRILDLTAPYIALGQSIGRIGCFLNGCCYGKEVAWGIFVPIHGANLHPTQIYSTVGLFCIFLFLKAYRNKASSGGIFILYLIFASALRFIVEFFRADHQTFFIGLSIFQMVCLSLIIVALILKIIISKKVSGKINHG